MRILISIPRFEPGKALGSEVFLSSFLKSFSKIITKEQVSVVASPATCMWGSALAKNFEWMPQILADSVIKRMMFERANTEKIARRWNADVVYFPFNIMPRMKMPSVLLLHDLVNEFYHERFPFYRPFYHRLVRHLVRKSIKNADSVITTSHTMIEEMASHDLKESGKRIRAVSLAVEPAIDKRKKPASWHLDDKKIILQSGAQLPHKSHITGVKALVEIYRQNKAVFDEIVLVLTGGINKDKRLKLFIEKHKLTDKVIFLGRLDAEEMEWIMASAKIASFPTLYEGFGLGIVDAQLRGIPVVATKLQIFKEIYGETVEFFKPENAADLAEKIIKILQSKDDKTLEVRKIAADKVVKWSWENHSIEVLKILRETAFA